MHSPRLPSHYQPKEKHTHTRIPASMPTAFQHYSSVTQRLQMSFFALMRLRTSLEMSELRMSLLRKSGLKLSEAHFDSINSVSQSWSPDSISRVDFCCLNAVGLIKNTCHGLSQTQIQISAQAHRCYRYAVEIR